MSPLDSAAAGGGATPRSSDAAGGRTGPSHRSAGPPRRGEAPPSRGTAAYWATAKVGDFVTLRDARSFAEGGGSGIDYRIREIRTIDLAGPGGRDARSSFESGRTDAPRRASPFGEPMPTPPPIATYLFLELERAGEGARFLVQVSSGQDFELRLYYPPAALAAGTRDELIDLGETWLFLPPPDPEDFISSDLEYAPWPDVPLLAEGAAKAIFGPTGFGRSVYGDCRETGLPAMITEYLAEGEAEDPLLLVLEEGWMRVDGVVPEEGGFVTPLAGCAIEGGNAELWPG